MRKSIESISTNEIITLAVWLAVLALIVEGEVCWSG
jgi:hypothetical protein